MTDSSQRQYLFACCCARSGTSTLADLLRSHSRIAMGRERSAVLVRHRKPLNDELFMPERFCHQLEEGDTHHKILDAYYEELFPRFDQCTHVGDKIPRIYEDYNIWRQAFPGAKFIYLLRNPFDVAQSFEQRTLASKKNGGVWPVTRDYRQAVEEWNLSLSNTLNNLTHKDILILEYESLYLDDTVLSQLFSFIGLPLDLKVKEFWRSAAKIRTELEASRVVTLDSQQKRYIARHARFDFYRQLVDTGVQQKNIGRDYRY